jgi:hypothetical protein
VDVVGSNGTTTQTIGPDGLVAAARISTDDGASVLEVEPLAFGPLLLVAPDGRRTHFQRAMAKVRMADGRSGIGWIEWNMVQSDA